MNGSSSGSFAQNATSCHFLKGNAQRVANPSKINWQRVAQTRAIKSVLAAKQNLAASTRVTLRTYLRNQRCGAITLFTASGPHEPTAYGSTGGGLVSSGSEISQTRSMPSALVNSDWSPSIASRISRS
jgi:hypothetical protein